MDWLKKRTGKKEPAPIPEPEVRVQQSAPIAPRQYAPDEVNEQGDYIKIGGSPVPGLTLRHVLRGHTDINKPHRLVARWQIPCLAF